MEQLKEIWKPIKGYKGLYEVSNLGKIKSLSNNKTKKENMLNPSPDSENYMVTALYNKSIIKVVKLAHIVWDNFGDKPRNGHKLQVDHINGDKSNNRIDNLQLLTNRQNSIKYRMTQKHSSKYVGVSLNKENNKWRALIQINNKSKHLGYFINEIDAHLAYQKALREIKHDT